MSASPALELGHHPLVDLLVEHGGVRRADGREHLVQQVAQRLARLARVGARPPLALELVPVDVGARAIVRRLPDERTQASKVRSVSGLHATASAPPRAKSRKRSDAERRIGGMRTPAAKTTLRSALVRAALTGVRDSFRDSRRRPGGRRRPPPPPVPGLLQDRRRAGVGGVARELAAAAEAASAVLLGDPRAQLRGGLLLLVPAILEVERIGGDVVKLGAVDEVAGVALDLEVGRLLRWAPRGLKM